MEKRIVFMGTPDFAVPSLIKLAENFNLVGVLTQPDRKAGRGRSLKPGPVKEAANKYQIPILQTHKLRNNIEAFEQLQAWQPDVIIVAAFGQILRKNILELAKFGCINVHASLLPRWRGASPINAAILNGDQETGITIMKMDAGVDTGDILAQRSIQTDQLNAGELSDKLAHLGANLLVESLPLLFSGSLKPMKQDDELATYAPMLKKEDGRLDFDKPAKDLARQIRAYSPWPGSFTKIEDKVFKIYEAYAANKTVAAIGQRLIYENLPAIQTSDGILVLTTLQPAGKKSMSADVFLRGSRDWLEVKKP